MAPRLAELWKANTSSVRSVSFAPDGQTLASGSDDNSVRLLVGCQMPRLANSGRPHVQRLCQSSFAPDERTLASGSSDKSVRLWVVQMAAPLRTLEATRPASGQSVLRRMEQTLASE